MPTRGSRMAVACTIGVFALLLVTYAGPSAFPDRASDFDQVWVAGRAALAGRDAYADIGPGRVFDWPWPFYYPMTASAVVAPLLVLPLAWARGVFVFSSAALLAWSLTREDWRYLPLFLGAPFVVNALAGQWAALLTAALGLPAIGWVFAAKPNALLWFLAFRPTRRGLAWSAAGGALALALSHAIDPHWVPRWLSLARQSYATGNTPSLLLAPGGALVLVALARWRHPEARLLVALAAAPASLSLYSFLPLALVAATRRESLWLALLSWLTLLVPQLGAWLAPELGGPSTMAVVYLACLFAPAVALVLRRPYDARRLPLIGAVAPEVSSTSP